MLRLARGDPAIEAGERCRRFRLGDDEASRRGCHHGVEVGLAIGGLNRIDADKERRAARRALEIFGRESPCGGAVGRCDGVFEVGGSGRRPHGLRLLELPLAVGGNEEHRTQEHRAFIPCETGRNGHSRPQTSTRVRGPECRDNLFDLTGKIALVTGGSRGLGSSRWSGAFARAGADVVIASRKLDACEAAADEARALGRQALAVSAHAGRCPRTISIG